MKYLSSQKHKGFTVVELLVSISIIGVLSTIVFASFSQAREKSRVTKRISDMKQIQVALEYYYAVNKAYPSTGGTGNWRSECVGWGGVKSDEVIMNPDPLSTQDKLVPKYLSAMPADPSMDKANNKSCYVYTSNGSDYALLDHDVTELYTSPYTYSNYPEFIDPARDSGANYSIVDGTGIWSWKVSTPGAVAW